MPLFRRGRAGQRRTADSEDVTHLQAWAEDRRGVEAFVEPRTAITETTVVLVEATGEWTRRRVGSPANIGKLARELRLPVYEAAVVGYPQRMRDWNARRKRESGL